MTLNNAETHLSLKNLLSGSLSLQSYFIVVSQRTLTSQLLGLTPVILPDPLAICSHCHTLDLKPVLLSQSISRISISNHCVLSLHFIPSSVSTLKVLDLNGTDCPITLLPFYHAHVSELFPYFSPHTAHMQSSVTASVTFLTLTMFLSHCFL